MYLIWYFQPPSFERMFTPTMGHHVTCHMSCIICLVSCVTCQVINDTFFLSFLDTVVELVGGASVINGTYPD